MRTLVELIVIVLSLATICVTIKCCKQEPETIIVTQSDTVVVIKYDTIRFESPVYVDRVVKDTFYVKVNADSVKKNTQNNAYYVKLEREQLHYSEKNKYDAWVSGFQPRLDSFVIYGKETTTSITKPLKNEKKWRCYTMLSYKNIYNTQSVSAGIQLAGQKVLVGGEVGVLNNKVYYGVNFGLRINED